jgi:hypothetical protein
VKPLADSLGLEINDAINRGDAKEVAKAAKGYDGPGNVLICWEHKVLSKIIAKLGVEKYGKGVVDGNVNKHGEIEYPGDRFDVIWTIKKPYDEINEVSSENVPGLDGNLPPL